MSGDWTEQLDRPENLLRLLLESMSDCAVFLLDAAGRVAGWNAGAERLFGYSEGEILGEPSSRFFLPEAVERGEPERELRTATAQGRSSEERWQVRKDGTRLWTTTTLAVQRNPQGAPQGYARITRNRTEEKLAHNAVEEQERRFRALIENGFDAVVLLSADGVVLYASPSTVHVIGYPPEEFVGRSALAPVHPDDLPRVSQLLGRLLEEPRTSHSAAFRYRHADGDWRWLEGVGTNLLSDPSVRAVAVNFRDVTRQREAEHLRSQLAAIVESSQDAIIAKDLDGAIVSWNKAAERLYGYKAEEVLGKPLALLIPPGQADELPGLMDRLKRGETIEHYEAVRVRKDGARLEVSLSISPIKDAEGRVVGAAKFAHDATARRQAERRQRLLAESGAVLTASLDDQAVLEGVARLAVPALADYCIIHLQMEGSAIRQAASAHVDPLKEDLLKELARIHRPEDYPESRVGRVLRTGRSELMAEYSLAADATMPFPERVLNICQQLQPRSFIVVPLAARGRVMGTIMLTAAESGRRYDAADLAFAEELAYRVALSVDNAHLYREVREADRRKSEWIATLAHELRNPLAPLLTGLHLLGRSKSDRAAVEQTQAMMERQVRHMARLVDDLLDVSRVARGKIHLRRERLDLARLVRTTAADQRHVLAEAGLNLTVKTPETPVWMTGDATRLAQVLGNLLDNAVKFTDRGGSVDVKVLVDECRGRVELRVRDSGVGIAAEALPQLFEAFNQADRSLHRTKGGLGLGLVLVKGLTELHGGEVRAISEGSHQGAEFRVSLPLEGEPAILSEKVVAPRAFPRAPADSGGGRQP